jgi:hypothetical protein
VAALAADAERRAQRLADVRGGRHGALGVADAVSLSGYGAEDFLIPPQIEAANS